MVKKDYRFTCKCGKLSTGRQCRECFCKKGTTTSVRRSMRRYNEKTTKSQGLKKDYLQ